MSPLIALLLALGAGGSLWVNTELQVAASERTYAPVGEMVSAGGTELHTLDEGNGPAVVIIHGLGGTMRAYLDSMATPLVDSGYRVVLMDRPGHGWSQDIHGSERGPEAQAAVINALLDTLGVDSATVMGVSWGGAVAAALALNHPEKVKSLLLVSPYLTPEERSVDFIFKVEEVPVLSGVLLNTVAVPVGKPISRVMTRRAFWPDPVPEGYIGNVPKLTQRPGNLRSNASDMRTINPALERMLPRYSELSIPVHVIVGDSDLMVPPEPNIALAKVTGWRLTVFHAAGHALHISRAKPIRDIVFETVRNSSL